MNKKRMFIPLLIVAILFSIASIIIGYSIWIVSDSVTKELTDNTKKLVYTIHNNQEVVFDSNKIQLPSHTQFNISISNDFFSDDDIIEYQYKKSTETNYKTIYKGQISQPVTYYLNSSSPIPGPYDAGTYDIKIVYDKDRTSNVEEETTEPITFKILPKPLTDSSISIEFKDNINIFAYTSSDITEIAENIRVKDGDTLLTKETNYRVSCSDIINVGTNHLATIEGIGNYTGTNSISYIIDETKSIQLSLDNTVPSYKGESNSLNLYEYTYTASQLENELNNLLIVKDNFNNSLTDYTINGTYTSGISNPSTGYPINKGAYTIKLTVSKPDYESAEISFLVQIKPVSLDNVTATLSQTEYTFNNQECRPTPTLSYNGVTLANTSDVTITYSNNTDANEGTSSRALVIIEGKSNGNYTGSKELQFVINQAELTLALPTFEKNNFIEGEVPRITNVGNAKFNNTVVSGNFSNNILSQTFTEGTNATETKTITFTFNPTDRNGNGISNYKVTTGTKDLTMYAVAYIKGTSNNYYGTIEKALTEVQTNQEVWVVNEIYDNTSFYPTIKSNCSINNGVKLILPYSISETQLGYRIFENEESTAQREDKTYPTNDSSQGKAALARINLDITLTIKNGGQLILGAFVSSNCAVGKHAVLMNNGTIELENNSNIFAYGYLKGQGILNARSGSNIYDCLRMYDFPGARYAGGMYYDKFNVIKSTYNNILPLNSYSTHNISCEMNIYYGSAYNAKTQINISEKMYVKSIKLIGVGGLFELTTQGGYIKRTVENSIEAEDINGSFTSSNQNQYQREKYLFYSNVKDNSITIEINIGINVKMTTSKDLAMPISMMDINITNGYKLSLQTNSYKFLPGSKVTVDNGGLLEVASGVVTVFYDQYYDNFKQINENNQVIQPSSFSYYIVHRNFYNEDNTVKEPYQSKLIVNGTVNCQGAIGGKIETTSENAQFVVTATKATIKRLTEIKYLDIDLATLLGAIFAKVSLGGKTTDDTIFLQFKLRNGAIVSENYSNVSSTGTYKSYKDANNNYGWYKV